MKRALTRIVASVFFLLVASSLAAAEDTAGGGSHSRHYGYNYDIDNADRIEVGFRENA